MHPALRCVWLAQRSGRIWNCIYVWFMCGTVDFLRRLFLRGYFLGFWFYGDLCDAAASAGGVVGNRSN